VKKYSFQVLFLTLTWVLISGSINFGTLVSGFLLGGLITYLFRDLYQGEVKLLKFGRVRYVVIYLFSFLKELFISNLGVAYLILHPSKQKNNCMIEYRTVLESSNALTLLANSISLTPGTLVVDCIEDENIMIIHCLNLADREETFEGIRKWEKLLQKIFGEKV